MILVLCVFHQTIAVVTSQPQIGYDGHIYVYYDSFPNGGGKLEAEQYVSTTSRCGVAGHLADLTTKEEADALAAFMDQSVPFNRVAWIGLNDQTTEGLYQWSNGDEATYFDWGLNGVKPEPDGGIVEDCVFLSALDLKWHDYGMCTMLLIVKQRGLFSHNPRFQ